MVCKEIEDKGIVVLSYKQKFFKIFDIRDCYGVVDFGIGVIVVNLI